MFFCAISGEPPQEPVVSTKSGNVYERRLIVKYINENGTDPITGDKLEESDLLDVKASPKTAAPRPPSHTSIPVLLQTLQNEWDALVLETFALKQQYNSTRQELSYALYNNDAAARVVARLVRERDAAREALSNVQATLGVAPSASATEDVEMATDAPAEEGLPQEVISRIDETHQTLSAARKKRKPPTGYATAAQIKTYSAKHTVPSLHSASPAGITSLVVSRSNPDHFLTGGNDKVLQLYDRSTDKVLASLKGHQKKINHVAFREKEGEPTLLLSGGADKIAKIWAHDEASEEYIPKSTIRTHKGEISGLAVHPTSTLLALSSIDKTYSLHDLSTFQQVYRSVTSDEPFHLSLHPSPMVLFSHWERPRRRYKYTTFELAPLPHPSAPPDATPFSIHTLSFSENGYHLLAPSSQSTVAVWDLRKQKAATTIDLGDDFKVNKVIYDVSAQFLGIAGNLGGRVYMNKSWEELVRFEEGGEMNDFVFGEMGKELWGVTGREVRIWSLPA
ncbi:Prp19-domain-containing protein [Gymnopus androsaceus JB14]|uniref:Pre-mRNA-processing factor 19 n=1 Tax=Gymnopus androsaceus JB14 TaxID=1447944 RepID=A0A6A4IJA7_9AGAR|nr:Prp19-domain-containing protein [Gymnopus androsaceus JB14]